MENKYYVYFVQAGENGPIKIGVAKNVKNRLRGLQTANPVKLKVLKNFEFSSEKRAREIEQRFHNFFKHTRMIGEWFRYKPFTVRYIENLFLEDNEVYDKSKSWDDCVFGIDIYNKFAATDHAIQRILKHLKEDGDYHAVEMIVDEIIESVTISTGIKLRK